DARALLDVPDEPGFVDARNEGVDPRGVPPPVHVRLAQRERAALQDAGEPPWFVDLDVPRIGSADLDVGEGQEVGDAGLGAHSLRLGNPRRKAQPWRFDFTLRSALSFASVLHRRV